jgi:hypothetical protein
MMRKRRASCDDDEGRRSMSTSLDASCGRCGYVLRGLPAGSHCPECALPTDWSLGMHALHETQRNDRTWTMQLRLGANVLLAAQVILVVSLACSIANDVVHFTRVPFFLWILPLVVILGAVGAWMVSIPTLFAQCDHWWGWVRRCLRGMLLITSIFGLALWLNEYRRFTDWRYPLGGMMIVWPIAIALTFAYLSASAEQLGSRRVASASRHVMWALPLGMIAPPVIALFTSLSVQPFSPTPAVVVSALICGAWFITSYSLAVTVLVYLRRAIHDLVLQRSLVSPTS